MEPITLTATAITTIIFSKVLETSGEHLGEAVSHKIGQLFNFIRDKFQQEGVEGKLLKAQDDPSEKNQDRFKRELVDLMEDDENFANQLQTLIEEIKSDEKANTIFFQGMNIKGNVRLGNVEMKSQGGNMSAVTDSEIEGDFTMGDVTMTNKGWNN